MIDPFADAPLIETGHQRLAGNRRGRRILARMADAVAVANAAVERVRCRDRDFTGLGSPDDVIVGADLRRGHDDAVDGRIPHDLVQDLDLAGGIVGRRFRSEQKDLRADHVGGDAGAHVDRVEETIPGGVRDDGERQLPVLRVEVLGFGSLLGGIFKAVAANGLGYAARLRQRARREQADAGGSQQTQFPVHVCFPPQWCGFDFFRALPPLIGARW